MKKLLIFIVALSLTFTLAGCTTEKIVEVEVEVPAELPEIPAVVNMANLDDYLGRPDVQYVDLRNFDDKMASGYIAGFEFIPFFDYLEYEGILVRQTGWTFTADDIKIAAGLEALFNPDKTIFLMCGSGTRAGYVLAALESLGYDNVINVGGIGTYLEGDAINAVPGDDVYTINMDKKGPFTPGTYYGYDTVGGYLTTLVIGPAGGIESVIFDAVYHGTTKQNLGDEYMLGSGKSWATEADELADYVVANQGWDGIILDELDITGLNASNVPHHFIEINHDGAVDAVAGVTIGVEGFVLSWNDAITKASSTDLGVVAINATLESWTAAHLNEFTYADGVYRGMDEAHGYSAVVTIEDGFIVDVFFDAIVVALDIIVDPLEVDPDEATVTNYTTKQVLGFDYGMVAYGGAAYEWFEHANMLGDAIVDAQEWSAAWDIIPGTDGGHDKFDVTDADVIDAVAGVTVGIEGFKVAFDEALNQAIN